MLKLLFLIPIMPLVGFLILALIGPRLSRKLIAVIGVGAVGAAALFTILVASSFLATPPPEHEFSQTLWSWMRVGDFQPNITFYLDSLSLIMSLVISFVGTLILLYSTEFMIDEEGYSRFFAYMNLFVSSMLILVLGNNLLLLYLGWEGVGLCSYLLIGFWYRDPENGRAARKAFLVTRVGDTALTIGLFLIFYHLGTLNIQELMARAAEAWPEGSSLPVAASLLILGGAVGKSAQLPLQVWLPDAMAGPTPVSALIHAATMVTAGVYLIARTHVLFSLAPAVMTIVAIVGALTLLLAGFSGITQWDIKRVLAYSTISQIGYMVLALGVGAWSAAIFHFMIHAFFKALLFLGAGVVILAMHHDHDMFHMGGLRRQMPFTFWTFLIGAASLSALPVITAGFYSKDLILWQTYASEQGSTVLYAAGLLGALLTSLYSFRMVFLTFFGAAKTEADYTPKLPIKIPLFILAALSLLAGFLEIPSTYGNLPFFTDFLHHTLPAAAILPSREGTEALSEIISGLVSVGGVALAYLFFLRAPQFATDLVRTPVGGFLHRWWFAGWGFDQLYDWVFVRPYIWLAQVNKDDIIDRFFDGVAALAQMANRALSASQTGRVRWYAAGIAVGAIISIALAVFL